VRRFYCRSQTCPKQTFTEPLPRFSSLMPDAHGG
jgi:hypothetical protein